MEVFWPEVIGYHLVNDQGLLVQYAVETQNGNFDFLPSIRNAALLKEIIERFAEASTDQEWRSRVDMKVLGRNSYPRRGRICCLVFLEVLPMDWRLWSATMLIAFAESRLMTKG